MKRFVTSALIFLFGFMLTASQVQAHHKCHKHHCRYHHCKTMKCKKMMKKHEMKTEKEMK